MGAFEGVLEYALEGALEASKASFTNPHEPVTAAA